MNLPRGAKKHKNGLITVPTRANSSGIARQLDSMPELQNIGNGRWKIKPNQTVIAAPAVTEPEVEVEPEPSAGTPASSGGNTQQ
jgi:hypothetical protein